MTRKSGVRRGLWSLCVLALSACGPAAAPVSPPQEPGEMWSGVFAQERPHEMNARVASGQRTLRPATLTDEERARCQEVAWNALRSPETWSQYFESPGSAAELALSESGIRYYRYRHDDGLVDVAIPSGAFVGWHPTYIGVTVDRATYEVLDMYESCWF